MATIVSTDDKQPNVTTVKGMYNRYVDIRKPYLDRARKAAELTLPTLIPEENNGRHTTYPTPYQGLGARGVNNLASKLLLALLPNQPFFRLAIDDFTLEQLTQDEDLRSDIEEAFNKIERAVTTDIDGSSLRVSIFEMLKHLIVGGNVLMYFDKKGQERVYPLSRYVCKRDPLGGLIEIIALDYLSASTMSPEMKAYLQVDEKNDSKEDSLELFTYIRRSPGGDGWIIHQECMDKILPGSAGYYPEEKLPWLALRWTKVSNEDYGRGYIEEYYGDLKSLEELTKAIVQGSAAAARVLFLLAPNGVTKAKDLDSAPNGAVRTGSAEDVTVLQMEKYNDFQIALQTIEMINQRLSFAFLLNTAIQRKGERVTAEEIRYMAGELEDALGGIYSILTEEFQRPLVALKMEQLQTKNLIPRLPKGVVKPVITTGMEALGRTKDLEKLQIFTEFLAPLGAEMLNMVLNLGDYTHRVGTALGLDMSGLVKTKDEIAQYMQQQQMQSMVESLGPNAINQMGQMVQNQQNSGGK